MLPQPEHNYQKKFVRLVSPSRLPFRNIKKTVKISYTGDNKKGAKQKQPKEDDKSKSKTHKKSKNKRAKKQHSRESQAKRLQQVPKDVPTSKQIDENND